MRDIDDVYRLLRNTLGDDDYEEYEQAINNFASAIEAALLANLAAAEMPERYDWVRDVGRGTTEDVYTEAQLREYGAACAAKQLSAEPHAWCIEGSCYMGMGEFAEVDAKSEAKRIGGTCYAYPIYTRSTT